MRIGALERAYTDAAIDWARTKTEVENSMKAPVDVGKIVGNWKIVLMVAGLIASNWIGNWFTSQPIREGMTILQEQMKGNTKIEDERAKAVKESVDDLRRQMEMRRLEIQNVANEVQQIRRAKP